jgi:uncharacterized protein
VNNEIPLKFRLLAAGFQVIGAVAPIVSIPITWILWTITKQLHPFVDQSGKSALNFQTSIALYIIVIAGSLGIICGVFPVNAIQLIVLFISYPVIFLFSVLILSSFVLSIFATILALNGKVYNYPLTITFLSESP